MNLKKYKSNKNIIIDRCSVTGCKCALFSSLIIRLVKSIDEQNKNLYTIFDTKYSYFLKCISNLPNLLPLKLQNNYFYKLNRYHKLKYKNKTKKQMTSK